MSAVLEQLDTFGPQRCERLTYEQAHEYTRRLARTPEQMAVLASLAGVLSVVGGLFGSLEWDTPSGPSIVVAALVIFLLGLAVGAGRQLIPARHRPIGWP